MASCSVKAIFPKTKQFFPDTRRRGGVLIQGVNTNSFAVTVVIFEWTGDSEVYDEGILGPNNVLSIDMARGPLINRPPPKEGFLPFGDINGYYWAVIKRQSDGRRVGSGRIPGRVPIDTKTYSFP